MSHKVKFLSFLTALTLVLSVFLGVGTPVPEVQALNNGLALTPPMGMNTWNKFGCNISDTLIRQLADAMVSSGMSAAGYKYLNIDDCWQGTGRTNGHVNLDPDFPNMKALGDYIHSKGLKYGLYSDHGDMTCQGRVGSYGFETTDANDYAAWGADYLKHDNCYIHPGSNIQTDYTNMRNALAATGRPIVFSICALTYQTWSPSVGNLWRTTGDISDSWASMSAIPNTNNASASVAGPGAWNDPDMLEVGNGGMTDTEYRTHFAWWAIMAAPLIAGNDIANMSTATKNILTASEIIAVDQDSLGKQGTRVWDGGNWQNIWSKQMSGTNRRAVFVLNGSSATTSITVNWSQLGLPTGNATVRDLWTKTDLGTFSSYTASNIPAHGSRMLMITSTGSGPTVTPGPTPTPGSGGGGIANGTYSLRNRATGKMLDNLGSTADGAIVGQWADGTSNNQKWTISTNGSYRKLMCITGSKYLDSLGHTADASTVGQWGSSASTNQDWTIQDLGGGYYKVINRANGKALDSGGGTTDGSQMQFWGSGGSNNQQWQFVAP